MAARNNGSKMVVAAVTLTLAAVGVGTIYLPFVADKDKIRGLDEDGGGSQQQQQQYQMMLREMELQRQAQQNNNSESPQQQQQKPPSNSMWKRMGS